MKKGNIVGQLTGVSGYGPNSLKTSANTNRWNGDFATGRIFGPTDANEPKIIGFNQRDFDFILDAINKALKKVKNENIHERHAKT